MNSGNQETAALGNPREELIYFDKDLSWSLEVDEFIDCVKTGRQVAVGSSHDALKAMELVHAIYDADDKWHAAEAPRATGKERVT